MMSTAIMNAYESEMHETSTKQSEQDYDWRQIKLTHHMTIPIIHPCTIEKFKEKGLTELMKQSIADDVATEDDESKWFCNGGDEEEGFVGGCKSGQMNFGYHEGTEGW